MTGGEQEPRGPLDIRWSDRAKDDLAAIGDYIVVPEVVGLSEAQTVAITKVEAALVAPPPRRRR